MGLLGLPPARRRTNDTLLRCLLALLRPATRPRGASPRRLAPLRSRPELAPAPAPPGRMRRAPAGNANGTSSDPAREVNDVTEVRCTVSNCYYWGDGNVCVAERILVVSDQAVKLLEKGLGDDEEFGEIGETPARASRETCCYTFRPK